MKTYTTIDQYIAAYPKAVQPILEKIRETIQKAAPKAEEAIRYGIPTFIFGGNLVHFGAFQHHIGFFPTSSGVAAFKKDLASYECSKGTVRFPLSEPIPYPLITKIVKFRVKESNAMQKEKASKGKSLSLKK